MTMLRTIAIAAVATLTASMASGIGLAHANPNAPRTVASKATTRFLPVAGTSKVLVYAKVTSAKPVGDDLPTDAVLYAMTPDHKKHRLGILGDFSDVTASGSSVDIGNLQQGVSTDTVRWWDFATDKHGTKTTNHHLFASPTGWLYVRYTSAGVGHVFSRTYTGKVTNLGAPLPAGVAFAVLASSNGVLVYGASNDNETDAAAEVRYMPWSNPGEFRTLYKPDFDENSCPGLTSTVAVCAYDGLAILPLGNGTNIIKPPMPNCSTTVVAFHTSAIYLTDSFGHGGCPDGQLGAVLDSGKVKESTRRLAVGYLQAALGRIVVANKSETELLSLTGVKKKPKVLVS